MVEKLVSDKEIQNSRTTKKSADWVIVGEYCDLNVIQLGIVYFHENFDCAIQDAAEMNENGNFVEVMSTKLYYKHIKKNQRKENSEFKAAQIII